ncbi:MAG: hypothetical protein ABUS48_02410 [Pseudomonadota bacterium]
MGRWHEVAGGAGPAAFSATGTFGNEAVVPWLMTAAVVFGLLTRSVVGAIVAAVVVYVGWFLVVKAFGGRFAARKIDPSILVRFCLLGAVGGFAAAFIAGLAGISVSLVLGAALGVAVGLCLYQFSPARKKSIT